MCRSSFRHFIFFAFILLVISGCKSVTVFDDTKSLPGDVWRTGQIIRFDVNIQDTVNIHKFYLSLRHESDYGYSNIFLFIHTTYPNGMAARDTVECILAEPSGKWLGKGITNIRDYQVLLRRGLRFPQTGNYIFELEQAMREPELQGIKDIGIRIVKE